MDNKKKLKITHFKAFYSKYPNKTKILENYRKKYPCNNFEKLKKNRENRAFLADLRCIDKNKAIIIQNKTVIIQNKTVIIQNKTVIDKLSKKKR